MNYQHVRAFCAIVAEGSFSRAACTLHLTQPTVSAQIQALEKYLGARLFERSAQGIALTQAGREFRPYALQLLQMADRAREAVEQMQGLARGRLEVGACAVPGHYLLPRALVCFKEHAPGVEVSLSVADGGEIRAAVQEGRFELGVVGEKSRDDGLVFEPVFRDDLVAVVRPCHAFCERDALSPDDLARTPLLMPARGSGSRAAVERAAGRSGLAPERLRVWMELGSVEAIKLALRSADALALLSRCSVDDELRAGKLRALPVEGMDLRRTFFLCRRTRGVLSAASERFREQLRHPDRDPGSSIRATEAARPRLPVAAR